jgi:hypothetical protein
LEYTLDDIMALGPCGEREEYSAMLPEGRIGLTIPEIATLPIPVCDRAWVMWRLTPEAAAGKAIEKTLIRIVTNHALHCGIPGVELWAAGWLSGADRSAAAGTKARAAAWAAAETWAWEAARAAEARAWAAERAARAAAGAAEAAAEARAWAAERAARAAAGAAAEAWEAARAAEAAAWAAAEAAARAAAGAEYESQIEDILHSL